MAQYLLSLHTSGTGERAAPTDEQMQDFMRRIGELEEEMTAAEALVYSGRLEDAEAAKVVRAQGGDTVVTDGPFTETKEQLGGFYIVDAEDLDEALAWASKTSSCVGRPIEVRPFFGLRGA